MRRDLLPLVGAAILVGFSIAALPFSQGLFHAPRTPYGEDPVWILLQSAEPLVPRGAHVLVRVEPHDPVYDSYLHRFGIGLLPGRTIVPSALWGVPTSSDVQRQADYEIVVGKRPQSPPGRLLLETPEGTVWRRGR